MAVDRFITVTYRDGYNGVCRFWPGEGKGTILYLHGIQSHGLWFEQSAEALAEKGYSVLLADRRGSGQNKDSRGDVKNFHQWITDQIDLIRWIERQTEHRQVHAVGVSWGGKPAMALAKIVPEAIKSLTLVAPGIFPAVDVSPKTKLRIAGALLLRRKTLFPIPLNNPELFTANPERQTFIEQDSLKLTHVTGNFLFQSRRLDRFIRMISEPLKMPIKLFLAGNERIIDNAATIRYYRGLKTRGVKETAYYPTAHHTLEFEKDNAIFIRDLQEWILRASNQ